MKLITFCLLILIGGISMTEVNAAQNNLLKLIPRKVLFGNPDKATARLSPDGKMMAYLAPVNNVLNVWVKTIGKNNDRAITKDTHRGIRNYFWQQDSQHILYMQDKDGNENWRLYGIDLSTGELKDWTPFDDVQVRVIEHDKDFPDEILLGLNKDNPKVHDVYHLNLKTGEMKQIAKNPGDIDDWIIDANLKVRGATATRPDGGFDLLVRDSEEGEFKKIGSWDFEDTINNGPLTFSKDGKSLLLKDSRGANASKLVRMNLQTGDLKVLAEDSVYDVSGVMLHPDTREVQAISYEKDRNEYVVFDPAIKKDFEYLAKICPGDFNVVSRDNADQNWLVVYLQDTAPVAYYAYDRKIHKGTFLFFTQPNLSHYQLAPMEPITIRARDGLTLHGYITFPKDTPKKNLPMVVNVHGGPWARDSWGYDPEAQWLANRGYICLQINFRGSTGFGKTFVNAGDKEWGGKMHNDIIDALAWAIHQGYADPKRIAIYGGSYGGYAALVGATFTPDVFKCAVSMVGPSNLITLINTVPPYWSTFLSNMKKRVGDPDKEEEFLKSRSPLFKVDNIKSPILIAQGANDPRVKRAESEQIVDAMKKKNLPYEYLLFEDEGHGFARPENRLKFFAAAEKFLSKYLGGRFEK